MTSFLYFIKHIFFTRLVYLFLVCCSILGTATLVNAQTKSTLRISILTCGTGEELYSSFGHSAVRIIDTNTSSDIVYNYGTFNFSDPDFYVKFTKGLLPYYIDADNYESFLNTYVYEKRFVYEQVLQLDSTDAQHIQAYLINNLKPENRAYKYDFCFDNCSTRIRDIFDKTFGKRYVWSKIIANDSVSYRTIINQYLSQAHWERFGINMLLSCKIDDKMTNESSMFLPDYLMRGFQQATLDGKPIVAQTIQLLPDNQTHAPKPNIPKRIFWILFIGIVMLSFSSWKKFMVYFDVLYFLILGLLGCFMLFMWFGTEHITCSWNRNLFIFLPTHFIFAFLLPRKPSWVSKYARMAMWLLLWAVVASLFASQKYMSELTPIILLTIYRLRHYTKQVHYLPF